jgi:hypothetical protein
VAANGNVHRKIQRNNNEGSHNSGADLSQDAKWIGGIQLKVAE